VYRGSPKAGQQRDAHRRAVEARRSAQPSVRVITVKDAKAKVLEKRKEEERAEAGDDRDAGHEDARGRDQQSSDESSEVDSDVELFQAAFKTPKRRKVRYANPSHSQAASMPSPLLPSMPSPLLPAGPSPSPGLAASPSLSSESAFSASAAAAATSEMDPLLRDADMEIHKYHAGVFATYKARQATQLKQKVWADLMKGLKRKAATLKSSRRDADQELGAKMLQRHRQLNALGDLIKIVAKLPTFAKPPFKATADKELQDPLLYVQKLIGAGVKPLKDDVVMAFNSALMTAIE
jgi:hypothetical protein